MRISAEGIVILKSPPRYVLLEHRWNGVHYDLMLEHQGWLRTWKMVEALRTGDQPVTALPRHRLAYLEYEGPVSGDRGTVRQVAAGTFEGHACEESEISVQLSGTLQGTLRLVLIQAPEWKLNWMPAVE